MKTISSAESDLVLSALRTLSAHRYEEEGDRQNVPDKRRIAIQYLLFRPFVGICSEEEGQIPLGENLARIHLGITKQYAADRNRVPSCSSCLYSKNHCAMPQSEIPHSI